MTSTRALLGLLPFIGFASAAHGQETRALPAHELTGTTIVTALREEGDAFDTPWSVDVVGERDIERKSYRSTPEALRDLPGVMLQATSFGQGSPYLRGFTGFRDLFLIDGIRLNNSVFREGPNQYWNTVDPLSLERIELVRGPSSVLYGSDAIGGTVNAITRLPYGFGPGGNVAGRTYYRISSAENSHVGRLEGSATSDERFGVLLGASGKTFGDIVGGRDIGTQENTGYDEWDADLKGEYFLSPDTRVVFLHQEVRQNDVPRTHSTVFAESFEGTTVGTDLRQHFDQRRRLSYVQIHAENQASFFDRATLSLSWHDQEEERDRIRSNGTRDLQGFDVGTLGAFGHLSSPTELGRFTYGVEYYRDGVDSFSSTNSVQGPVADDATYDLLGIFVQDEIALSERLDLILGTRFDYARADAESVLDPVTSQKISIEDDWNAVVGSARLLYRLTEELNLFGGVSQGFRTPNLSDLSRFDTARTNEFEIPAPGLDPEYYTSFEIGAKIERERTSAQAAVFYTDIRDQIVRFPTGNVNASGDFEITKDNVGDGEVWGVEVGASQRLAPSWTLFWNGTFLDGEVETFPTSAQVLTQEPIDRLMPLTFQLGLLWEGAEEGLWSEVSGVWADDADELSTRDAADTQRIPPGGTPGYAVLNLRGGYALAQGVDLVVGLENVLDEDYRIHGSGSNSPGRNLVVSLSARL